MTAFDLYVKELEDKRRARRNREMNEEISRRLRARSDEDAFAALLSLSLFRCVGEPACAETFALA